MQSMSLGIDKRLRSLRCKYVKDWRLDKESNNNWWADIMGFTRIAEINEGNTKPSNSRLVGRE